MSDKPLDPRRLKELVGEMKTPADGSEAIHRIDASGHAQKSIKEITAAAVAAIEAVDDPRRPSSTDARRPVVAIRPSRTPYYVLALLATVVFSVYHLLRRPPPPVPGDPVELVAVLSPAAAASPILPPEWSTTRATSEPLGERERAVRIGSLLVEFERAAARGDSTAQAFANAIGALVADLPDGADVAEIYTDGGDGARRPEARHALAAFARAMPMSLGGWLQAARIAASAGDVGFFASQQSREGLTQLLTLTRVSPEVEAARDRLDTLLHRRGRPDFAAVSGALDIVQRELAN